MSKKYDQKKHHRRSIRLKGYNYTQEGFYFITICIQHRLHLLGGIKDGEMILNDAGNMVEQEWLKLPQRFPNIALHEFVVMPNHFHAIIEILPISNGQECADADGRKCADAVRATLVVAPNAQNPDDMGQPRDMGQPQGIAPTQTPQSDPPRKKRLGDMIGAFESITTVEYIRGVKTNGWQRFNGKLWQRNYWEHIIRNEKSFYNISNYIINNPANWEKDKFQN